MTTNSLANVDKQNTCFYLLYSAISGTIQFVISSVTTRNCSINFQSITIPGLVWLLSQNG